MVGVPPLPRELPRWGRTSSGAENQQKRKERMKKIIMIIALMMPMIASAATMCSKNDTITIVLDPSIAGNSTGTNAYYSLWRTSFSYGTIQGITACLSTNKNSSTGTTVADLHDNNTLVVGGETNGPYCWCRMTHPALSLWTYQYSLGTLIQCQQNCVANCANAVKNSSSSLRQGLFGSVGR